MTRKVLLTCGLVAPLLYVATDILAGNLYPGYSFTAQAVSELFAIGAPTSRFVVPLFTVHSLLLLAFALGIWMSASRNRALRVMAWMVVGNAVNSLVLWNFFPMHMRGIEKTLTDTMHIILAVNPFVLLTVIFGVAAFRNGFRLYSMATILIMLVPAVFSFSNVARLAANEPTPWLGLGERISQYGNLLWQLALAGLLLRSTPPVTDSAA